MENLLIITQNKTKSAKTIGIPDIPIDNNAS